MRRQARKHCFLAMFPEGGHTRKHCFLSMFPEGGQARKHCFLAMFPEGGHTRKYCFLSMFPEGGQTRKHCFLAMFTSALTFRIHQSGTSIAIDEIKIIRNVLSCSWLHVNHMFCNITIWRSSLQVACPVCLNQG